MSTQAASSHETITHDTTGHEEHGEDVFSTDIVGLPAGVPTPTVELSDGDIIDLASRR